MRSSVPFDRRRLLSALAGGAVPLPALAQSPAQPAAGPPELLVASPRGGRLDRWAEPIAAAVGRALPSRAPLTRYNMGGLDGVTGANRFEARAEPDGSMALLAPGTATLSWLVGESRAQFDPARWVPLWATTAPAVLVSRVRADPGTTLRVAAASPVGAELPALLALDLAGVRAVPASPAEAEAVLLQGGPMPALIQAAAAQGMVPILTLGVAGEDGRVERDPLLPTVPTFDEVARGRAPARMIAALGAACAAVRLDAGLVLPQLTPADAVATWRRACQPLLRDPDAMAEAGRLGAQMLPGAAAAALLGRIAGDTDVLLGLRQWLDARFGWRAA